MINQSLLTRCSNAHGVSGFESEVREIVRTELAPHCSLHSFPSGNLIAELPASSCASPDAPRVMLAAHMDEVGFMVQSVTPDGYLLVVPLGGWWNHTLPSQRMTVIAHDGSKHPAIVGSKSPHLIPAAQRSQVLPNEALCIDIGASCASEVEQLGIYPGCPVCPEASVTPLSIPQRWMGKAFDNRVGVYTMIEVMRSLAEESSDKKLPCQLSAAATVQEELGTRGAKALARECIPDVMVVLEGPPADDTMGMPASGRMGQLGHGVQVRLYDPTHLTHPALARLVRQIATEQEIPVQWAVRSTGGTDAAASYSHWQGIPTIVLGVPVRYIHSHQGILDERDVLAMQRLCCALIRALDSQALTAMC